MYRFFRQLQTADWFLISGAFTLVILGLAAIYSIELSYGDSDFLNIQKQVVSALVGLGVFFAVAGSNYHLLRNYALISYVIGVASLAGVLAFGVTIRGTTGWYAIGPVSFQPVELMKVALAVSLAAYFSRRARLDFGWRELLESGIITALPVGLVLMQPDLGSAALLLGMWGILVLFAGMKKRHLATLVVAMAIVSVVAWSFLLAPYQKDRLRTFVNPAADPLGQGYNVAQAMIAVGAGGWLGSGLGFGSQSQLKFLPESQTDFIFAVIAEELGFVGVILLLGAFALVFFRIWHFASSTRDDFTSFLLIGIGGTLFVQFFINVGMNLGLLPVTGVALPLVSYGGSSLLFTLVMLGIVESVTVRSRG
ncbi:rod shape-determining protein RodA [Candidatus Uhrbacteria bacterium RIFOXYB12_FULL_58_10]|uniref:Rod shape-determining protein RodA n=1 Tax=Candidatus Uhrbacteria bacterium RIFOXYB2_FULL_57_15 TaxID=1802422 RepID=A0A1F7W928_9BACT|nr:MAG: rod shape-determining protein RodA [Candidatus Uhrbacteria bacterium RIFOXYB12_FULL_58_10]OGL98888.1 MAG: rod shape-determining protein RodA [Candidatus Uhrbacteria bacterium RIFOXYB2_FULL_57_15]OGM00345.1 MAG: rod shape-determining protein RodA [Candidatus Uhrbacteria bacterium RIFOXYC12_FULL_57_11]